MAQERFGWTRDLLNKKDIERLGENVKIAKLFCAFEPVSITLRKRMDIEYAPQKKGES